MQLKRKKKEMQQISPEDCFLFYTFVEKKNTIKLFHDRIKSLSFKML